MIRLYTYWRSQASYRVRIALHLKGLAAETVHLDLLKGDQHAADYRAVNPEMVVPSLIDGDGPPLVQSLAILEYLDEKHPHPPLLPADIRARAQARALAQMVAMDAHPFIVPRVRAYLERELGVGEAARTKWIAHWLNEATRGLEETLARDAHAQPFCCGEAPSIADICLAAHLTSVQLFCGNDLGPYPIVRRIFE